MEISDQLRCLFSATVEERGDSYVVEVPEQEVRLHNLYIRMFTTATTSVCILLSISPPLVTIPYFPFHENF